LIGLKPHKKADYIITVHWSERAAIEAGKYGHINHVVPKRKHFTTIPDRSEWKLDPEASYVYLCDNETIHGVEFDCVPDVGDVPLVADCSSNFLSRKIGLNHILEQNHQKLQNIRNLKIGLFLLILSFFQNRKTLNVE
jgi:phosphoserine aminotransferase